MPAAEQGTTGRWPLIDAWNGTCAAGNFTPAREHLLANCNLGYAREACARFPASDARDAVRFTVLMGDDSRVHFVVEGAHNPMVHGFADEAADAVIRRQAEAFLVSYRKRSSQRSNPA